jgi:molecular chaperone HtpG
MSQYSFDAEIPKLMNMIINNFYSSKDIFIRELISNASDALNKLKHKSLDYPHYIESYTDFDIKIRSDKSSNTLIIEDSGIGMTKDDLINCLGTIAKSGTEEFSKNLALMLKKDDKTKNNSNLIGQFGVGFYSAFLVADKVKLYTKHPDSESILLWESDAINGYNISEVKPDQEINLKRGTRIVLNIKPDQIEYLDELKLTELVKKHSGFVSYPIYLIKTIKKEEKTEEPKLDSIETVEEEPKLDSIETVEEEPKLDSIETVEEEPKLDSIETVEEEPKLDSIETEEEEVKLDFVETVEEEVKFETVLEQLNTEPLWVKSPSDVTELEYDEFYKAISLESDTYAKVKHFKAEASTDFSSILFTPKKAPFDMFNRSDKPKSNIKLYVKKVLITENCPELYPEYFNFVKGVVDCNDLPLNASRELLQQSKVLKQINKTLVKKTIEMFNELAESNESYKNFYTEFGKNIKLAIYEDKINRNKLLELVRYHTSKSDLEQVSLATYFDRMLEKQSGIYYINSDSLTNAKSSPLIEKLKASNIEVIYMAEAIDEYLMQSIETYKDKKFINVSKDDLKLKDFINSESDDPSIDTTVVDKLCLTIKNIMGDIIEKVVVSDKLVSQPAVVTNTNGVSANMERIMKAQTLGNDQMFKYMSSHKVIEINPDHKLIQKIIDFSDSEKSNQSDYVKVIYQMALLAGGYQLDNMNEFLSKLYEII